MKELIQELEANNYSHVIFSREDKYNLYFKGFDNVLLKDCTIRLSKLDGWSYWQVEGSGYWNIGEIYKGAIA